MTTNHKYLLTDMINLNPDNSFYETEETLPELSSYLYEIVDDAIESDEAWDRVRGIAGTLANSVLSHEDQDFLKRIGINIQPVNNVGTEQHHHEKDTIHNEEEQAVGNFQKR